MITESGIASRTGRPAKNLYAGKWKCTLRGFYWLSLMLLCANSYGQIAPAAASSIAVGPQYDTSHVYVSPSETDAFTRAFLGMFGGTSTKQVVVTVTPTPSKTTSQLLQTPVGTVSLFGFETPIPAPFGAERRGYLVRNMGAAVDAARAAGADLIVKPFPDPIGVDAVLQWPGGMNMQIYWHTSSPTYKAFDHVPEDRVYVSPDRADSFVRSFLQFSQGRVLSDDVQAPGMDIGAAGSSYRRIRIESNFGKMTVLVTDGHLVYPYGRETTGYEVHDLDATLAKGKAFGVTILVAPHTSGGRKSAMVQFPGGYIAEVHATLEQ